MSLYAPEPDHLRMVDNAVKNAYYKKRRDASKRARDTRRSIRLECFYVSRYNLQKEMLETYLSNHPEISYRELFRKRANTHLFIFTKPEIRERVWLDVFMLGKEK